MIFICLTVCFHVHTEKDNNNEHYNEHKDEPCGLGHPNDVLHSAGTDASSLMLHINQNGGCDDFLLAGLPPEIINSLHVSRSLRSMQADRGNVCGHGRLL